LYGNLAKRIYEIAQKEGWSKNKVFEFLQEPQKIIRVLENVIFTPITICVIEKT